MVLLGLVKQCSFWHFRIVMVLFLGDFFLNNSRKKSRISPIRHHTSIRNSCVQHELNTNYNRSLPLPKSRNPKDMIQNHEEKKGRTEDAPTLNNPAGERERRTSTFPILVDYLDFFFTGASKASFVISSVMNSVHMRSCERIQLLRVPSKESVI